MQINYAGTGSSDGRNQFKNHTVDFAVSEIPYGVTDNGVTEPPPSRPYAYMPIVAGGTSFMYHLDVGGQRITNLRLSGKTIADIFTGNVTMWNDPEIRADNPQISLPPRQIVPVVRGDGSGTTAQLTTWMARQYPSIWNAYCAKAGRNSNPCGTTSFYPVASGSDFIVKSLSTGVAGYVAQPTSEGAITYVEYSYARNANFPVAKMLNSSGYYTSPTASDVAVALLKAQINPDLTQNLGNVYTDSDPRTYPLSSYSYMILPTSTEAPFTADKGRTLGAFAYYFLCQGQQDADRLGYSPLPINLVEAGFNQVRRIPGVNVQSINVANCNNPTFSTNGTNTLATNAPMPQPCDKQGPIQCGSGDGSGGGSGGTGGSGSGTGGPAAQAAPADRPRAAQGPEPARVLAPARPGEPDRVREPRGLTPTPACPMAAVPAPGTGPPATAPR
jgi:phosphate ABC transporter phosphate-binding protein